MFRFCILVAALLLSAPTPALATARSANVPVDADSIKYWIFLTDKVDVAGKSAFVPVASRAFERRSLRADHGADVELDRPVSGAYLQRLESLGIEPIVRSRWLNAVSAWMTPGQAVEASSLPFVAEVRPVGSVLPLADVEPGPVSPPARGRSAAPIEFGNSFTQLDIAGAVAPLQSGWNGAGVRLGIIDTSLGDLSTHPALSHLASSGRLVASRDFTGQPDDGNRHARSVLSVAAGYHEGFLVGPAWGAEVLHARTEYVPTETNQEEDSFVAGLEWMESEGVDVVNVSLGYSEFDPGQRSYVVSDMDGQTAVTTRAAEIAVSLGVVVVSSAGNEGCASPQLCWYYITSPADGPSVITAGGVTAARIRSVFSGYGPTADGRTKPDVAAMATSVYLANSGTGYSYSNGTSFSAPMVSGIVALLLQADPYLKPAQIRDLLRATASQASQPDNSLGWGIVNAQAAMETLTESKSAIPEPSGTGLTFWPNPFADHLYAVSQRDPDAGPARVEFFDILGRRLAEIEAPASSSGTWHIDLRAISLPAGVVLYRFTAGDLVDSGSLVHAR